jgi:hypothetical protein
MVGGSQSATTTTGRQASARAAYPALARRSWPRTEKVIAGWASANRNWAKPPVGRY